MGLGFRERREVRLVDGDDRLTLVASLEHGRVTWCDDCRAGSCGHGSAQLTAAWDTWTPQLGLLHMDDAGAEAERLAALDDPARQFAERTGTRYVPPPPERSKQAIREGRARARALLAKSRAIAEHARITTTKRRKRRRVTHMTGPKVLKPTVRRESNLTPEEQRDERRAAFLATKGIR